LTVRRMPGQLPFEVCRAVKAAVTNWPHSAPFLCLLVSYQPLAIIWLGFRVPEAPTACRNIILRCCGIHYNPRLPTDTAAARRRR